MKGATKDDGDASPTRPPPEKFDVQKHVRGVGEDSSSVSSDEFLDLDELKEGSRVIARCEKGQKWQATILERHERNGVPGFYIHYKGLKKKAKKKYWDWVPSIDIVSAEDTNKATKQQPNPLSSSKGLHVRVEENQGLDKEAVPTVPPPDDCTAPAVRRRYRMKHSGQIMDCSGDPIEYTPNDVFLSYTIPAYKEAMFNKFRELDSDGSDSRGAAKEILDWFKEGGGRFFKLIDMKNKFFEEVGDEAALASEYITCHLVWFAFVHLTLCFPC